MNDYSKELAMLPVAMMGIIVAIFGNCGHAAEEADEQAEERIVATSEKRLNGEFVDQPLSEVLQAIEEQSGVDLKLAMGCENLPVTIEFVDTPLWEGVLKLCQDYDLAITRFGAGMPIDSSPAGLIDMRVFGKGLLQVRIMSVQDPHARGEPQLLLEYWHDQDESLFAVLEELELTTASETHILKANQGGGGFNWTWRSVLPREIQPDEVVAIRAVFRFQFCEKFRVIHIKPEKGQEATDGDVTLSVQEVRDLDPDDGKVDVELKMFWDNGMSEDVNEEFAALESKPYAVLTDREKEWVWDMGRQAERRHAAGVFLERPDGTSLKLTNFFWGSLTGFEIERVQLPPADLPGANLRVLVADVDVTRLEYTFGEDEGASQDAAQPDQ